MRPLAVARILTIPPPAAPSTSTLSRLSCAFWSSFCAFCAICMIDSKSGISGMSGAFDCEGFELGFRTRVHHCPDIGIGKHIGANALLGDFLLVKQRGFAGLVRKRDSPGCAGRGLERRRQIARPVATQRPQWLHRDLRRCVPNEADLIVKLDRELVLAALLEPLDERR